MSVGPVQPEQAVSVSNAPTNAKVLGIGGHVAFVAVSAHLEESGAVEVD
jgi:hypothetical protein